MQTVHFDNIIDTLRNLELTVSLLYETFAKTFPFDKNRWQNLAEEKRLHARCLATLKHNHNNQMASFNETKIVIHNMNKFIEFLHKQIDWARANNINIRDALLLAEKIENIVLENSFLDSFCSNSPKAEAVKQMVIRDTKNYRKGISCWLETVENEAQLMVA